MNSKRLFANIIHFTLALCLILTVNTSCKSSKSDKDPANNEPLNDPSGLTVTAASASQINLSWIDNSSNETGFKIERADDNSGVPGNWNEIATTSTNVASFNDTGLSALTTYHYRVRAYNSSEDSGYTDIKYATTDPTPVTIPDTPLGLGATAESSSTIQLTWNDNSDNEEGFTIERANDNGGSPGTWALLKNVAAGITLYNDNALSAQTTYHYRIRAYNSAGASSYTDSVSATTQAMALVVPNAPSGLTLTAESSTEIGLSWTDNSDNEQGFIIQRANDNAGSPGTWNTLTNVGANVTTYSDTGLSPSTKYHYRVSAYNAKGGSGNSPSASTTTLDAPAVTPNAPLTLDATAESSSSILITWTDNSDNEQGFRIERANDDAGSPGTWSTLTNVGAGVATYTDTGLTAETTYHYRVCAYNSIGDSDFATSYATTQAEPVVIPDAPSGIAATAISSTSIQVTWTDNSVNEQGFRIEKASDNAGSPGTWNFLANVAADVTTYTDTGLTASTKYHYRVRAYNSVGGSAYITTSGTTSAPPVTGSYIIVDHRHVSLFNSIPASYLNAAKSKLVWIVGESHSYQIPTGLERLETANSTYNVQVGTTSSPGDLTDTTAMRVYRGHYSEYGWSEYGLGDEGYWATPYARTTVVNTAKQAITDGKPFYLSLYCWCWDFSWDNWVHDESGNSITFNQERFNAYIAAIRSFNNNTAINQTKFLFQTAVSDGCGADAGGWRVTKYNQMMRDEVIANGGILFDQADIENWNINNTAQRTETYTDSDGTHTLYLRHESYDADEAGHASFALCERKAKAFWVLMAFIEGWDGK